MNTMRRYMDMMPSATRGTLYRRICMFNAGIGCLCRHTSVTLNITSTRGLTNKEVDPPYLHLRGRFAFAFDSGCTIRSALMDHSSNSLSLSLASSFQPLVDSISVFSFFAALLVYRIYLNNNSFPSSGQKEFKKIVEIEGGV